MKTLLLTGGSGLLALNWARMMVPTWSVKLALNNRLIELNGAEAHVVKLDSAEAFGGLLDRLAPDLVVHTAGLTNVDLCEKMPEAAEHINVRIPATVAACCASRGIRLVHISTDHLFSGSQPMLAEDAPIEPVNVYGRTKGQAESEVLAADPTALVARTNFYGWGPSYRRSFSDRIIDSLRQGKETLLFEDVHFTPILADVFVETVHDLVDRDAKGVYHLVGDERLSKHEFGLRIAATFGLDRKLIRTGRLSDLSSTTVRPAEMSLANNKGRTLLGRNFGDVDAQLRRLAATEADLRVKELQKL